MRLNDNTMVKISRHGTCIEISTYSRRFGKHGRFMIVADTLLEYFNGGRKRHFFDTDCGNILEMSFHDGKCIMEFTWLSSWGNGHVEGVRECVVVPRAEMVDFMCYSEHDRKMLSGAQMEDGKVEFTKSAMRNIRNLNKRQRRAFCIIWARKQTQSDWLPRPASPAGNVFMNMMRMTSPASTRQMPSVCPRIRFSRRWLPEVNAPVSRFSAFLFAVSLT